MGNPFEGPKSGGVAPARSPDDVDASELRTPLLVSVAGAALAVASLFVAASGMQVIVLVYVWSWWKVVPYMLLLLGTGGLLLGGMVTTGRVWAVVLGAALNAFMGFLTLVWTVYAMMNGLLALLPLVAVLLSGLAMLLLPLSIPGARRVSRARAQLLA
jgi:hypothetical protein